MRATDDRHLRARDARDVPDTRRGTPRGIALVLTMLILVALTLPALALLVSSQREMSGMSREVSRRIATYGADAVAVQGSLWLETQNALGPPARVNQLGITDAAEDGFWAIRNFGGVGDSDTSVASNYASISPDLTLNSGSANAQTAWFRVSAPPNTSRFVNRVPGEEAGTGVQNVFVVDGISTHLGAAVTVEMRFAQVYGNAGYE